MAQWFRTTLGLLGAGGLAAIALAPAAARPASLSCTGVSPATVGATIGATVGPPNSSTSTNSFDGYKATVLACTYSSSLSISYSTPATSASWAKTEATLKGAAAAKAVSGLGKGAFSGTGSNTISSCNAKTGKCTNKTVTDDNLWVFVPGKAIVEISATASQVSLVREEALARKVVAAL